MRLRPYQQQVITEVYQAWEEGAQNVVAQLATGAGKTVIFSHIIAQHCGYAIAIAHRVELVSQISLTLARHGIRHNIIGQKSGIREIVSIHMSELGRSFYDPSARTAVAGVDTLIRMPPDTGWFRLIDLVVQDEAHHVLKNNKWGTAAALFPNARGLYPTATPLRADGRGLGRHADGIADIMIIGPSMRELINVGYLSDYRIFAPPSDLNLDHVAITSTGDFNPHTLRDAVHKSHIVGDIVEHYLKIAPGKLGVTFAVDIEAASQIAAEFRAAGVPAEVVSSKTPALLRSQIMRRFRERKILQLVNVDILGEGVDVPAIEVISMGRPTASFGLYCQQVGRALRPKPDGERAIIIDHAGNVTRHGLPDAPRSWSLNRRGKRSRKKIDDVPVRTCLQCYSVFPRTNRTCPHCGFYTPPTRRDAPEHVDGDLLELDPDVLARLRGEIDAVNSAPRIPGHLDSIAQRGIRNKHHAKQLAQAELRHQISNWAGYPKADGLTDSEIYRLFYHTFGIDIGTAQTLGATAAEELTKRVDQDRRVRYDKLTERATTG